MLLIEGVVISQCSLEISGVDNFFVFISNRQIVCTGRGIKTGQEVSILSRVVTSCSEVVRLICTVNTVVGFSVLSI